MNIHPLLVHFPIGLLMTYAFLEIIRFKHFHTKATLVILGTLGGYATIITGFMAKRLLPPDSVTYMIASKHQIFAITSISIFTLISIFYLLKKETKLTWFLALMGALGLMITGALGGSMVYGPENDPVTNWIYNQIF